MRSLSSSGGEVPKEEEQKLVLPGACTAAFKIFLLLNRFRRSFFLSPRQQSQESLSKQSVVVLESSCSTAVDRRGSTLIPIMIGLINMIIKCRTHLFTIHDQQSTTATDHRPTKHGIVLSFPFIRHHEMKSYHPPPDQMCHHPHQPNSLLLCLDPCHFEFHGR